MTNKAILAVAGGGKTESIVQRCKTKPRRRLLVTYTTTGQQELRGRIFGAACKEAPEVVGWYSFLIENFLKPYYPSFRPGSSYPGFSFKYKAVRGASGDRTFSDPEGKIGREKLAFIARRVYEASNGGPLRRLESMYEEIVFDEVQDLVASDLVILEWLLGSSIDVYMVGDLRQTVFETTTSDTKYKQYRGAKKLDWFKEQERKGLLKVTHSIDNHRCSSDIVSLSNKIFDPAYGFADAKSSQEEISSHLGIFRISEEDVEDYVAHFSPLILRWNKNSAKKFAGRIPMHNFGKVKGLTVDNVLIFPTPKMTKFLENGHALEKEAAAKLYVGVTRAKFSVAFVLRKNAVSLDLRKWPP